MIDGTIAAIASAQAGSARGVVRLSGPETLGVLARAFGDSFGSGAHRRARLPIEDGAVLPVSLTVFHAPRSYTGEDGAEVMTVGNPLVLSRVLERMIACGARQAQPGEFTARAFLAGKLTLDEAESIGARIAAERDEELDAADRVRSGVFGARCAAWADRLAGLLALVEAGIDFTDQEDVVAIEPGRLIEELRGLSREIGASSDGQGVREASSSVPTAVLVGPPNAGKSTLFNALIGRERSVVADAAGTTRDAIVESLGIHGNEVTLVDLPGLDAAARRSGAGTTDAHAQAAARNAIGSADLLIACDPAGRFEVVPNRGAIPVLRVRTKADLSGGPGPVSPEGEPPGLAVCALDGWHLEALRHAIADLATRGSGGDAAIPRHRRAIANALGAIRDALESLEQGDSGVSEPETVAALLRLALDELGSIVGSITPDEVLGRVFASFCVGK